MNKTQFVIAITRKNWKHFLRPLSREYALLYAIYDALHVNGLKKNGPVIPSLI